MVDFPNNPSDGDTHVEEGTEWKYSDPPGAWYVVNTGTPVKQEFHDPTGVASWRIVGNALECWGGASAGGVITFPKTFARPPTVVTSGGVTVSDKTATSCTLSGAGDWHAIGQWDSVS